MRWTVGQVAEALGVAAPARLDALAGLAGVSIDSRTVSPENCSSPYTDRVTTDTIIVAAALLAARLPGWWRADDSRQYTEEIRGEAFAVDDTLAALQRLAARACEIWRAGEAGTPHRRRGRLGGKNDHQGNSCGAGGRAVPRFEDPGKFEQRIRVAADAAAIGRRARCGRARNGNVASRRTGAPGAASRRRTSASSRASPSSIWNFFLRSRRLRWPSAS